MSSPKVKPVSWQTNDKSVRFYVEHNRAKGKLGSDDAPQFLSIRYAQLAFLDILDKGKRERGNIHAGGDIINKFPKKGPGI